MASALPGASAVKLGLMNLCFQLNYESSLQWVGPVEDMEAEFDKIDKNGGGQILFSEFVDWALEKDLDIEVRNWSQDLHTAT